MLRDSNAPNRLSKGSHRPGTNPAYTGPIKPLLGQAPDNIIKDHLFRENVRRAKGSPRMYANILLSTDGSDVARKGVKHGIALAKALNAKVTIITVTEPPPLIYYGPSR